MKGTPVFIISSTDINWVRNEGHYQCKNAICWIQNWNVL